MSRKKTSQKASRAWRRAQEAAAQTKPAAAQARSLARSTGAAAQRGVRRTRSWAVPRVERTGQVLQDSVAPKVSAWLSAAARRVEPEKQRSQRWYKLAGASLLTAAASAAAALARNRRKPGAASTAAEAEAGTAASAGPAQAQQQARAGSDGGAKDKARSS
jgi:hypothetical protein